MKKCQECYIPEDHWTVVRIDGHNFSKIIRARFIQPFDMQFSGMMIQTARYLMEIFNGVYAYTHSDEISILLPRSLSAPSNSVENIISLSSSVASSRFSIELGTAVQFISEVWFSETVENVKDFFVERQTDAKSYALKGLTLWALKEGGRSELMATNAISGMADTELMKVLEDNGSNFLEAPTWQRLGIGIWWEHSRGRSLMHVERELHEFEEYRNFLKLIVET